MELAKKDIRALSKEALQDFFIAQGQQAYRAAQVYQWLWSKGVHDFDKMTKALVAAAPCYANKEVKAGQTIKK